MNERLQVRLREYGVRKCNEAQTETYWRGVSGLASGISIVLASSQIFVLQRIARVLKAHFDLNVVAACSDAGAGWRAVQVFMPDVAVLDVAMLDSNAGAWMAAAARTAQRTKLIGLAAVMAGEEIAAARAAGAMGLLCADAAPNTLTRSIRMVAAGGHCLPTDDAEAAPSEDAKARPDNVSLFSRLSPREQQVALLVSEGISNKIMARRLGLSEGTVKIHLHNIYGKLDIANRTALAVIAMNSGILP
jgi:two-component system, NarL family, nitrate/nitrite response regulator NarL